MTDSLADGIRQGSLELGLKLVDSQQKKFSNYIGLLEKWNRVYNLTAITKPQLMLSHHLMDSLVVGQYLSPEQCSILDVGSGAGLPGVPLSILFPEKNFTLLDSNGKKTRFMKQTIIELSLHNCTVVNQRLEHFQTEQKYDVIISRAFSNITDFVNGARHLLKPQGQFYAMKGLLPNEELKVLPAQTKLVALEQLKVPFLDEQRHLVILGTDF